MNHSMPGLPVHQQLLESTQTHVCCIGDAIQPSHPLSSPFSSCLQSFPPSGSFQMSQLFVSGGQSIGVSASSEHPGLIPFRVDWLDLLAVQGTLKSLVQHHSSNASILWCSTFFIVQLSHPYMTTGKTIALTRWTFVDKVMSLLFNMLSNMSNMMLLFDSRYTVLMIVTFDIVEEKNITPFLQWKDSGIHSTTSSPVWDENPSPSSSERKASVDKYKD